MFDSLFGRSKPTGRAGSFLAGDRAWLALLLLASLLLYLVNLGGVPLRDWDEGIYADVSRTMLKAPAAAQAWLYPMIRGQPFTDKPPLLYWLMARAYAIGGVSEWTARLPGALLTALSVPLLYAIGRELFATQRAALFGAGVYLGMLPMVRHGRLAMLDGAALCFFLLMVYCLLRARRTPVWGLGLGLAFALVCLTKGILGLLLLGVVLVFVALDCPQLLRSVYLWGGLVAGSLAVGWWYGAQWLHYGLEYMGYVGGEKNFARVWKSTDQNQGPPWYYLLELLKYTWPWLIFLPQALVLAWRSRAESWARLVLLWLAIFLVVISAMATKLPWYVLPVYPAIALAVGHYLSLISKAAPRSWLAGLVLLAVVGWGGCLYFGAFAAPGDRDLLATVLVLALTMTLALVLVRRSGSQAALVLLGGSYCCCLLFLLSSHWVWELNEAYPVPPVARLIRRWTPTGSQRLYFLCPRSAIARFLQRSSGDPGFEQ